MRIFGNVARRSQLRGTVTNKNKSSPEYKSQNMVKVET